MLSLGLDEMVNSYYSWATLLSNGLFPASYCEEIITCPRAVFVEFKAFALVLLNSNTNPCTL